MPAVVIAMALAAVLVAIVLGRRPAAVTTVPPVPHATTAAEEARNLEAWLRRYSGSR